MRRLNIVAAVVVAAVVAMVGGIYTYSLLTPSAQPPKVVELKAGDSFPFAEQFFLVEMTGEDRGFFEDHRLAPDFVSFRGSSRLYEAVAAGQVSIGYGICGDIIAHRSLGVPIKIVAVYVLGNPWRVLVRGDSPLSSVEELDGRRVATAGVRGIDHLLGVVIEKKYGIDMEFVPLGGVPQMLAAIRSGDIDAFIQTPGPTQTLVDSGELRVLFKVEGVLPKPWPSFCVWATDDMIKSRPDVVREFVKSTLESVDYIQANPDYAVDLYIKRTNASSTIANKVVGSIRWQSNGIIDRDGLKNLVDVYILGGDIAPNTTMQVEDTYDGRFVTGS